MWERPDDGRAHFAHAAALGVETDDAFLRDLTHQLLNYEATFGSAATQSVLQNLALYLEPIGTRAAVNRLKALYSVNQAFEDYNAEEYGKVPTEVLRAAAHNPRYLANRGVLSILFRSVLHLGRYQRSQH
jgi:hypothetical protein